MNYLAIILRAALDTLEAAAENEDTAALVAPLVTLEETAAAWLVELEGEPEPEPEPEPNPTPAQGEMWLSVNEIASLPMSGGAWEAMKKAADNPGAIEISHNARGDVDTMAAGLVYARTGDAAYLDKVVAAIETIITETSGFNALSAGRSVPGYVIAADLVRLAEFNPALDAAFRAWLIWIRDTVHTGSGPDHSLTSAPKSEPENWGAMCLAAWIAINIYLGESLHEAASVLRGFCGEPDGFRWQVDDFDDEGLSWSHDPAGPVPINPVGSAKEGRNIDGVIIDDLGRGSAFTWPPKITTYVPECLQALAVCANLLTGQEYIAWSYGDEAILRAARWWVAPDGGNFTFSGDDEWLPHILNHFYGLSGDDAFATVTPAAPGKIAGWTDWTHGT